MAISQRSRQAIVRGGDTFFRGVVGIGDAIFGGIATAAGMDSSKSSNYFTERKEIEAKARRKLLEKKIMAEMSRRY